MPYRLAYSQISWRHFLCLCICLCLSLSLLSLTHTLFLYLCLSLPHFLSLLSLSLLPSLLPSFLFFVFCLFSLFFWNRVSLCCAGCPETHFVDQAGLEPRIPCESDSRVKAFSNWGFLLPDDFSMCQTDTNLANTAFFFLCTPLSWCRLLRFMRCNLFQLSGPGALLWMLVHRYYETEWNVYGHWNVEGKSVRPRQLQGLW